MTFISPEYLEQNVLMHEDTSKNFGVAGKAYARVVDKVAVDFGCETFLDYGCGKRTLQAFMPHLNFAGYDPAIPEFSELPEPADLVVCLDVMEHIEPEYLDRVLDHIQELTLRVAVLAISTRPAHKLLPDGRNPHLIVEEPEWWLPKLTLRWDLFTFQQGEDCFYTILMRRADA
jgi:hypothetical protein